MNEHMVRSALGSTSGGAGSPNGLTEGVYFKILERSNIGTRPVGEALSLPKLTQRSGSLNGNCQKLLSSWLPPGGSWIFYQAALRNRLIKKTDEGRRQVGLQMQLDEWHMFWFSPFNGEI